jgi:hypothetical protein
MGRSKGQDLPREWKEASLKVWAIRLSTYFEALSLDDKQAFALEILRRTRELPLDSGPISDEEIGVLLPVNTCLISAFKKKKK